MRRSPCQYCRTSLIATSTRHAAGVREEHVVEPGPVRQPLREPDRRLVREPAEHHVRHAVELVADRRVDAPGAGSRGSRTTSDAIPSISSRPSASVSRTPCADTTGSGGAAAGIGPYGCQTRRAIQLEQLVVHRARPYRVVLGLQPISRRAEEVPVPGSIDTRSAASGWKRRLERVDEARDAEVRALGQVARAAGADAAAVDHGHARLRRSSAGLVRVADEEDERAAAAARP